MDRQRVQEEVVVVEGGRSVRRDRGPYTKQQRKEREKKREKRERAKEAGRTFSAKGNAEEKRK